MKDHDPLVAALTPPISDDVVLTFENVRAVLDLSRTTFYRLLKSGHGPPTIRLTPRRSGIRRADLRRWLDERAQTLRNKV